MCGGGRHQVGRNKKAEALFCENFRTVLPRVEGGTRTHDIQNHNLTL